MRRLILAAFGVLAVAGAASAQQPIPLGPAHPVPLPAGYQQPTFAQPAPAVAPPVATAPIVAQPVQPVSGSNVGTVAAPTFGSNVRGAFQMVTGGDCRYGNGCQNGCGSVKSDLAFHFGSCKDFFNPCGPTCTPLFGSGGFFGGGKCPKQGFAAPFGTGWHCPRQYDSYANH